MKNNGFYNMFLELIGEIYDAENLIVTAFPHLIQSVTHKELKEVLHSHYAETKEQVVRLKKIFAILQVQPFIKKSRSIEGLLLDAENVVKKKAISGSVRDAFLIICLQKIEHFEVALYGSALTLAKHFENIFKGDVDFHKMASFLKETLHEELKADKKLTDIAEGSFFRSGVNDEAEKELRAFRH